MDGLGMQDVHPAIYFDLKSPFPGDFTTSGQPSRCVTTIRCRPTQVTCSVTGHKHSRRGQSSRLGPNSTPSTARVAEPEVGRTPSPNPFELGGMDLESEDS